MSDDLNSKTCRLDVCRECTLGCCQDVTPPLTKDRIRLIRDYLESQGKCDEQFLTRTEYAFPSVDSNGFCTFYDQKMKKCLIHPVKPETCRAGPVTFDINFGTRKVEWFLKKGEICLLARQLLETPKQFSEHLAVAKEELMRLICQLDHGSLLAILRKAEPQTFKIGEDPLPQEIV